MRITVTSTTTVAMCALFMGMATSASAQVFVATGRDTLRGLPGVEVAVESVEPDLEHGGLTRLVIQSDVERRLRSGGVIVYASQRENPSEAKAYVYVQVNGVRLPDQDLYAIGVQVQLRQTLRSPVTASNIVDAMTWDAHDVVVAKIGSVTNVRDVVQDYVDQFTRDWMAVHR